MTLETLQGHGARQCANAPTLLPAESFRHLLHKRTNRTSSPTEDQVVGVGEIQSERVIMFHTDN